MSSSRRISLTKKARHNPTIVQTISDDELALLYPEIACYPKGDKDRIVAAYASGDYPNLLKYARACGLESFSLHGYARYMAYRREHSKDTASVQYLTALYGDADRAASTFAQRIQSRQNCYDPEYIAARESISLDAAKDVILNYKASKATSLIGFIARHGDVIGRKKFKRFQDTSASSTNFSHWLMTYNGSDPNADWLIYLRQHSKRCIEYWMHNYALDCHEARSMVSLHQRETAGVHRSFYRKKGYTDAEIDGIMSDINARKDGSSISGIRDKYPDLCPIKVLERYEQICRKKARNPTPETLLKIRRSLEENGYWVPLEILAAYEQYRREVISTTNRQNLSGLQHYEKRGRAGTDGAYQLDHRFSIRQGFLQNVTPELIGHIANLIFVPWEINVRKQDRCDITLEELEQKR